MRLDANCTVASASAIYTEVHKVNEVGKESFTPDAASNLITSDAMSKG